MPSAEHATDAQMAVGLFVVHDTPEFVLVYIVETSLQAARIVPFADDATETQVAGPCRCVHDLPESVLVYMKPADVS